MIPRTKAYRGLKRAPRDRAVKGNEARWIVWGEAARSPSLGGGRCRAREPGFAAGGTHRDCFAYARSDEVSEARNHSREQRADDRRSLQRQIDPSDREIERLLYDLYGLTADEIKIVEQATAT